MSDTTPSTPPQFDPSTFNAQAALDSGYTPTDVATYLGQQTGFNTAAAMQKGFGASDVITHLTGQKVEADQGWLATLQQGAHNAGTSAAGVAGLVGSGLDDVGLKGAGDYARGIGREIESITPDAAPDATGTDPIRQLERGNYGGALQDIGKSVVGGALSYAPAIVASVGGSPLAGAAVAGAQSLGSSGAAHAAAQGQDAASANVNQLTPSDAGKAALNAGLGMVPGVGSVGGRLAAGALGNAGATALTNYMDTGSPGSLRDIGNAALVGGAGAGAFESRVLPGMARKAAADGIQAAASRGMADNLDAAGLQSVDRVGATLDRYAQANPKVSSFANANAAKGDLLNALNSQVRDWQDIGLLSPDEMADVRTSLSQAQRSNNTITEGMDGMSTAFDGVQAIKSIPTDQLQAFTNGIRDLNTLSTQSFLNRGTGPLTKLGQTVGRFGQMAAAPVIALHGMPVEAGMALLTGGEHGIGQRLGGVVGQIGDRLMGTNVPQVVLQRLAANRAMRAQGMAPGSYGDAIGNLQGARNIPPSGMPPHTGPTIDPFETGEQSGSGPTPPPPPPPNGPSTGPSPGPASPPGAGPSTGPSAAPQPPPQPDVITDAQQAAAAQQAAQGAQYGMSRIPGVGGRYLSNGLLQMSDQQVADGLRQLEASGALSEGATDQLLRSNIPINSKHASTIKRMLSQNFAAQQAIAKAQAMAASKAAMAQNDRSASN